MLIREADPLCPESGNQRPPSESHHPRGETRPTLPGSGDQHLPQQSLSGQRDQGIMPWNSKKHLHHDVSRPSAACRGH